MSGLLLPTRSQVDRVFLSVTCESWLGDEPSADLAVLRAYFEPIRKVAPDAVDIGDEPAASVHDREVECWWGVAEADLTLDQWLEVARDYLLEIGEDEVLPADRLVETMGVLTGFGVRPAVALEGTEEGWGSSWYQPALLASFYISLTTKTEETDQ